MPTLHEAARYYAALGIPVFPLVPTTKIPLKGSGGVKDATTDLAKIDAWWRGTPDANIGGATGVKFDVLDVDDGGEESLMKHDAIPKTPETITASGGTHLFFKPSPVPLKNAVSIDPGLDFRTTGGYVVLPPSVNCESGWKWKIKLDLKALVDCPEWLINALKREPEADPERKPPAIPAAVVTEHTRNDSLFRFACRLRRNGLDQLEIMGALMAVNRTRCKPQLADAELAKIAMSASKYQAQPQDVPDTEIEIPQEARSGWIGEFSTDGVKTGVPSGYEFIDSNTQMGGFPDRQLIMISAYTGVGKTSEMLWSAYNIAKRGETVGFVTFADFSAEDLNDRMVTQICGWKGPTPPVRVRCATGGKPRRTR